MRTERTNGGDGQNRAAEKAIPCVPSPPPDDGEGRAKGADKATDGVPSPSSSIEATIAGIRRAHRERCFAMEQRKRADLSLGSFLRTALGWSKALPEKERQAIAKRAAALVMAVESIGKPKEWPRDDPAYDWLSDIIIASLAARKPFDAIEARALKQMVKLAKTLPVYAWAKDVRGFGEASLAVIAAEAGDLNNYATHSKLWKRMGVAVMDGVRQGGLAKNAAKDDWIAHGYNRQRRSRLWNIGNSMLKAQVRKVLDDDGEDQGERTALGIYGTAYLSRKAYEVARDPEIAPIVAHRHAQRYMEKKLLRDLWRAWRNEPQASGSVPETAGALVPAVHQDERKASYSLPEMVTDMVPSAQQNEDGAIPRVPETAEPALPHPRLNEPQAKKRLPEAAGGVMPAVHPI